MTGLRNVIPVPGADNPARIYLELVPDADRGTVLVRPGPSGRRLPKFWVTWLRELIMFNLAASHTTYRVKLLGDRVIVQSPNGFDKALAIARAAAGKIYQLPPCPLVPIGDQKRRVSPQWRIDGMEEELVWRCPASGHRFYGEDRLPAMFQQAAATAESLNLPEGVRLEVGYGYERVRGDFVRCITLTLHKDTNNPLKLGDITDRVKLAFTLARVQSDASTVAA